MKPLRAVVEGMRAKHRFYIAYPGICLMTDENHGKSLSRYSKGARLIRSERNSFSRLGHRERWPGLSCWPQPPFIFASGDGV